jgi:signal transduction histidine kinase
MAGFLTLVYISNRVINNNNEYILNKEMIETNKDLDIYLKQYFLVNNMDINNISIKVEGDNISKELSYKIGNKVVVYDSNGKPINSSIDNDFNIPNDIIEKALQGKIAYTITKLNEKTLVNLSCPIYSDDKLICIICYSKDYSEMYSSNQRLLNMLIIFIVVIFIIILIISYIISSQITGPITELTKKSMEISKGNLDVHINIKSKDEIGELSRNFKYMLEKIKSQISIIKKDRDELKEIQKKNKIFFNNVTHELNTPLTTLLGYSQLISEGGYKDEALLKKATFHIISESRRLNRMVVDLLELSKATSNDYNYHFSKTNLSKILSDTCEEMSFKAQRYNISIDCSINSNLIIYGDKDRLKEVVINLIDNSIKYGYVNSVIKVKGYRLNEKIIIEISDYGEGISEENLKNVFEPFYRVSKRLSREKGSSGLGLPLTKAIIEKHNGSIDLKSKVNVGTEIKIYLPADI